MRKVKHESCLCQTCENFGCYEKGLDRALELLVQALSKEPSDAEGPNNESDDESDPILLEPEFKLLQELAQFERRYQKVCFPFLGGVTFELIAS